MTWTRSDQLDLDEGETRPDAEWAPVCDFCNDWWPDGLIAPFHNDIDRVTARGGASPRSDELLVCGPCMRRLCRKEAELVRDEHVAWGMPDPLAAVIASEGVWRRAAEITDQARQAVEDAARELAERPRAA